MTGDPFDDAPARPPWLMTLADLALLLVGFLLLAQAARRDVLAAALRERFAGVAAPAPVPAMPVAAMAAEFAPGSAAAGDTGALVAWAAAAARDPRVTLTVTGAAGGGDPAGNAALLLAADRARAVAARLAPAVPAGRLAIAVDTHPGRRQALVTLSFTGVRP